MNTLEHLKSDFMTLFLGEFYDEALVLLAAIRITAKHQQLVIECRLKF